MIFGVQNHLSLISAYPVLKIEFNVQLFISIILSLVRHKRHLSVFLLTKMFFWQGFYFGGLPSSFGGLS